MAKYRAVVVGCGDIAARHIKGWQAHPAVDLVAVADVHEAAARRRAEEFGIGKIYTDYREMFRAERPDLVSVCTWMIAHAEVTVAAAEAGARGILCEKPLAGSLEEVDRMLEAGRARGAKIAVGHHGRFSRANMEARRLIAEGAIGTPALLHRRSGGGLLNNGSHAIDGIRYLLGDPAPVWVLGQVERQTDRYERHDPIEDLCGGIVAFEGGVRAVLESDLPEPTPPGAGALVYGTEGTLIVGREGVRLLNGQTGGWKEVATGPGDAGVEQAAELVDWVEGRVERHRNAAEGNRTAIEVLMGLYESARIRGIVRFPLPSGPSPLRRMIEDGTLPVTAPGRYDIRIKA